MGLCQRASRREQMINVFYSDICFKKQNNQSLLFVKWLEILKTILSLISVLYKIAIWGPEFFDSLIFESSYYLCWKNFEQLRVNSPAIFCKSRKFERASVFCVFITVAACIPVNWQRQKVKKRNCCLN